MQIYFILTVLTITPVTEKIQKINRTLISLNCFPEALIITKYSQATQNHQVKMESMLIVFIVVCICLSHYLFISTDLFPNFLSDFTKVLIKLLIKHLFICFDLNETSTRKNIE